MQQICVIEKIAHFFLGFNKLNLLLFKYVSFTLTPFSSFLFVLKLVIFATREILKAWTIFVW